MHYRAPLGGPGATLNPQRSMVRRCQWVNRLLPVAATDGMAKLYRRGPDFQLANSRSWEHQWCNLTPQQVPQRYEPSAVPEGERAGTVTEFDPSTFPADSPTLAYLGLMARHIGSLIVLGMKIQQTAAAGPGMDKREKDMSVMSATCKAAFQ